MAPQAPQVPTYTPQQAGAYAAPVPKRPVDLRNPLGDGFTANPDFATILGAYVYCGIVGLAVGIAATVVHFTFLGVGIGLAILLVGLFLLNLGQFVLDALLYVDTRILLAVFDGRVPGELSQWQLNTQVRAFDTPIGMRGWFPSFLEQTFWTLSKLITACFTFTFAILCVILTAVTLGFGLNIFGAIVVEMAAAHLAMNMPRYIKATSRSKGEIDPAATAMEAGEGLEPYKPPLANDAGVPPPPSYSAAATAGGPGIPNGPVTTTTTTTTTAATPANEESPEAPSGNDAPAPPKPPIDGDAV